MLNINRISFSANTPIKFDPEKKKQRKLSSFSPSRPIHTPIDMLQIKNNTTAILEEAENIINNALVIEPGAKFPASLHETYIANGSGPRADYLIFTKNNGKNQILLKSKKMPDKTNYIPLSENDAQSLGDKVEKCASIECLKDFEDFNIHKNHMIDFMDNLQKMTAKKKLQWAASENQDETTFRTKLKGYNISLVEPKRIDEDIYLKITKKGKDEKKPVMVIFKEIDQEKATDLFSYIDNNGLDYSANAEKKYMTELGFLDMTNPKQMKNFAAALEKMGFVRKNKED